jgi:two-component system, NarL family, nitrate/nitrite response regulator NarL
MTVHQRPARVAVVERYRLVAQTLELALAPICHPLLVPVQSLHSTDAVLTETLRQRPDAVVVDMNLGGSVDCELLVEELAARGHVVVVLTDDDEARRAAPLRAGAAATVPRERGLSAVRDTVERIARRRPLMDADDRSRLLRSADRPQATGPRREALQRLGQLSRRETTVLWMLMRGHAPADIARIHVVSELTVRSQVKSILRKLEVSSQLAAVAAAWQAGWHPPLVEPAA